MADPITPTSFWTDLSQLLNGAAAGAGAGRAAQGSYENARDLIAARLYESAQTARERAASQNLLNDKFQTSLPGEGANESIRGSLIQNAQDATVNLGNSHITPISFTGGTRPSSFTPATRQAGADLQAHGARMIADPGSFVTKTPGSGVSGQSFLDAPKQSPKIDPSFWEQAAGAGGITSGLLGALAKPGALDKLKKLLGGGAPSSSAGPDSEPTGMPTIDPVTGEVTSRVGGVQGTDDQGGYYDENGQYVMPDDPYGSNSNGGGTDDQGGYYDENGQYVMPGEDSGSGGGSTTGTDPWDE